MKTLTLRYRDELANDVSELEFVMLVTMSTGVLRVHDWPSSARKTRVPMVVEVKEPQSIK